MVTLDLKQEIIIRSLQGRSNRAIARELKIDRKTVNKYVKEYLEAKEEIATSESIEGERLRSLTEQMTQAPQYPKRNSPSRKWNEEMDECLDEILASEERKRALLGTSKQQLKKNQIFALMKEKGFDIGYTTVCQKINERQAKPKEAFIAQDYSYGCRFEYDFGEVILYIAGKRRKVFMAVMSAPASGYRFARLYFNQKQAVFIDSQIRFFTHMGGVFEYGVYDNMKNAVARFTGREKQLNPALVQFSLYYGFRVQTTNCYAGVAILNETNFIRP